MPYFGNFTAQKNGAKEPDAHRAGPCGTEFYDSMNRPQSVKKMYACVKNRSINCFQYNFHYLCNAFTSHIIYSYTGNRP